MQENKNDAEKEVIVKNKLFSVYGKKRKTPNEFTKFGDAVEEFKMEVLKALKIPQIVEWLSKRLK